MKIVYINTNAVISVSRDISSLLSDTDIHNSEFHDLQDSDLFQRL